MMVMVVGGGAVRDRDSHRARTYNIRRGLCVIASGYFVLALASLLGLIRIPSSLSCRKLNLTHKTVARATNHEAARVLPALRS
jgi:hypothetical protein